MNRILSLSLVAVLSILSLSANNNIKDAFMSMPTSISYDISSVNKTELIATYKYEKKAISVKNKFEEDIIIENLTDDYLLLSRGTNSNNSLQLIILSASIYCVINTVCGPICDSNIEFYNTSWHKLNSDKFIALAPLSSFVNNTENFPELFIPFYQFTYNPNNKVLTLKNNSLQYLGLEDQKKIEPYVKTETVEYLWNGERF
ncbi:hypothetical protein M2138_001552 [Dysgonomonadaceae bacterium PH5-43]|nr:hypothetical protein [Dysgonomonadaceae bacterium PH5-43]